MRAGGPALAELRRQLERCRRCGGSLGTPWCWDPACPGPAARLAHPVAPGSALDPSTWPRPRLEELRTQLELEARVRAGELRAEIRRLVASVELAVMFLPEGTL